MLQHLAFIYASQVDLKSRPRPVETNLSSLRFRRVVSETTVAKFMRAYVCAEILTLKAVLIILFVFRNLSIKYPHSIYPFKLFDAFQSFTLKEWAVPLPPPLSGQIFLPWTLVGPSRSFNGKDRNNQK